MANRRPVLPVTGRLNRSLAGVRRRRRLGPLLGGCVGNMLVRRGYVRVAVAVRRGVTRMWRLGLGVSCPRRRRRLVVRSGLVLGVSNMLMLGIVLWW